MVTVRTNRKNDRKLLLSTQNSDYNNRTLLDSLSFPTCSISHSELIKQSLKSMRKANKSTTSRTKQVQKTRHKSTRTSPRLCPIKRATRFDIAFIIQRISKALRTSHRQGKTQNNQASPPPCERSVGLNPLLACINRRKGQFLRKTNRVSIQTTFKPPEVGRATSVQTPTNQS